MRPLHLLLFVLASLGAFAQDVRSFGAFGGFNLPITLDEGLARDPRFRSKLGVRGSPFGFSYGYDFQGRVGFMIRPSYTQIGQQYLVSNITGGDVGVRDIVMDYITLPVDFKLRLLNLAAVRINLVAGLTMGYLINGRETLSFSASTLQYPDQVRVPADPLYSPNPDGGVSVPSVSNQEYVSRGKFNTFQLFAGLGLRPELDLSDKWSVSLDVRFNYGFFDSRTMAYRNDLNQPIEAPDLPGMRRDMYLSVELGLSRFIQIENRKTFRISNDPLNKIRNGVQSEPSSNKPLNRIVRDRPSIDGESAAGSTKFAKGAKKFNYSTPDKISNKPLNKTPKSKHEADETPSPALRSAGAVRQSGAPWLSNAPLKKAKPKGASNLGVKPSGVPRRLGGASPADRKSTATPQQRVGRQKNSISGDTPSTSPRQQRVSRRKNRISGDTPYQTPSKKNFGSKQKVKAGKPIPKPGKGRIKKRSRRG